MTAAEVKTVRIGFFPPGDSSWLGGVNYFGNLFFAVAEYGAGRYECVVFLGRKADPEIVAKYARHATVVQTSILDRGTPAFLLRALSKRLGSFTPVTWMLRRHRVDVVSHVTGYVGDMGVPASGWIPDFQHKALPELFTAEGLAVRDRDYAELGERSDLLILSSESARKDALGMKGCRRDRIRVLRFPSPEDVRRLDDAELVALREKHGLPERYIHLPNQFWPHKNHLTAFRAMREVVKTAPDVLLVCTGRLDPIANPEYAREVDDYLSVQGLEKNVRLLGVVPYGDMLGIMQGAVAVLNPSRFEGWSTSVEEARHLCKRLVLSDLPVHREQDVPGSLFFGPESSQELATQLLSCWRGGLPELMASEFKAGKISRRDFFASYERILKELLGRN